MFVFCTIFTKCTLPGALYFLDTLTKDREVVPNSLTMWCILSIACNFLSQVQLRMCLLVYKTTWKKLLSEWFSASRKRLEF